MTTADEGVIKFKLAYTQAGPVAMDAYTALCEWRDTLWEHALIGQDRARYGGYGFGNVSQRSDQQSYILGQRAFIISGTQTGHLRTLAADHYTLVESYDIIENFVHASGPIRPSSESLTHGTLYDLDDRIRVILHAHTPDIWNAATKLGLPVTDASVPYGTPDMAREVARLFKDTDVANIKLFSMGGHLDGVISFGETAEEAGNRLLKALADSQGLFDDTTGC